MLGFCRAFSFAGETGGNFTGFLNQKGGPHGKISIYIRIGDRRPPPIKSATKSPMASWMPCWKRTLTPGWPARPPAPPGLVSIMGEISTSCYVDIPKLAREIVKEIGYDRAKYGFDCDTCAVITTIDEQSTDIALGVDNALGGEKRPDSGRPGHWSRRPGDDVRLCLR